MGTAGKKGNIGEIGQKLSSDLRELGDAVGTRRAEVLDSVVEFVHERPIAALGIAFGVGYVVAGGLFSRTTGRVLRLGSRLLIGRVIREAMIGAGLSALTGIGEASEIH